MRETLAPLRRRSRKQGAPLSIRTRRVAATARPPTDVPSIIRPATFDASVVVLPTVVASWPLDATSVPFSTVAA